MKNVIELLKKNEKIVITVLVIIILGLAILNIVSNKSISIQTVDEEYYALKYDSTWKLIEKEKNKILFKHRSGSIVTIEIKELNDEYQFLTMEDMIDNIIHSIKNQNSNYNLISSKEDYLTKDNYEGYKLLYENGTSQVMISTYKKSDKLIIIKYEADNKYFDILLDSVHNIIYNLNIKEEKIDLKTSLNIELGDISYTSDTEFDKKLINNKEYELANKHYEVKLSIPDIFELRTLDTTSINLNYSDEDYNKLTINADIKQKNIYEYIDKTQEFSTVYSNYKYYHNEDSKDYSNFKESIAKLDSEYDSYIYKNNYDYTSPYNEKTKKQESVQLIYALNNNRILIIEIEGDGLPITEKLVNSIKILAVKNYSSYIKIEKENGYLVGKLKKNNYSSGICEVKLMIPEKYKEIDEGDTLAQNFYEKRVYGLNYQEDKDIYDYKVTYELKGNYGLDTRIETKNSSISKVYGKYHYFTKSKSININGKEFEVADGGYTAKGGIFLSTKNRFLYYVYEKVLYYKISENDGLYIEIEGHGNKITDDVLKDLTIFTINKES